MKNKKTGIQRLLSATKNSLDGLWATLRSEAAFRQDCLLAAVLLCVAFAADVSKAERCALVIPLFVLMIAEILNSAIEKCVDLVSPEFHPLAKFAKDAGSAAVFVALANIAVCWIAVFAF